MTKYKPRRASARWLEGAPEYVLDVFDNKGKTIDRYTVLFGGSLLEPTLLEKRLVLCLDMSDAPNSQYSQWGEWPASHRPSHQRIRWNDLPQHIRGHVTARATEN